MARRYCRDENECRFILDTMLGELARWLRILGYDTLYSRVYSDKQIINIAEKTGRIIVTRDRGLYKWALKRGLKAVYVRFDDIRGRLAELIATLGLNPIADPARSRCPECNAPLTIVLDKERVRDRVPPGAYEAYDVFYLCPRCGRVYWEGGHWRNIRRVLEEARRLAEEMRVAEARRPRRAQRKRRRDSGEAGEG